MFRRVGYLAVAGVAVLGGCVTFHAFAPRAAWRDAEEQACMAEPGGLATVSYDRLQRIRGPESCGVFAPLKVMAVANGVTMAPSPTLDCPMTTALDGWMTDSVEPAALAWFGEPVTEVKQIASYGCRTIDNLPGEGLSEHAFGNALDIAAFTLEDGRTITIKTDWNGVPDAKGFLHEVFAAACARFKTVLGPGEPYHGDQFHLDLAHQNADGTARYCDPKPDVIPPDRPPYVGPAAVAANAPLFGLDPKTTASILYTPAR